MVDVDNSLNTVMENSCEYFQSPGLFHPTHKECKEESSKIENEKRLEIERHRQEESKQENIKIIRRQTDYNLEQAEEALVRNKSVEKCIEEFLGVKKNIEPKNISTNQAIYKSIREWMN